MCHSLATLDSPLSVLSAHSLGFWSNYRSNIFQGWAAAVHSIQSDLSQGKVHWRTGTVEATTDLVKTAATKSVYCDAVCSIPELFTRASAAHKEMFTHSGASPDAIILCRAPRPLHSTLHGGPVGYDSRCPYRGAFAKQSYAASQAHRRYEWLGQEQGSPAPPMWRFGVHLAGVQEVRQYQDHEDLKKRVHCTMGGAERFAGGQAAPRDEGQSKAAATGPCIALPQHSETAFEQKRKMSQCSSDTWKT